MISFKTPKAPVKVYGSATVDIKNGMAQLYTDEGETIYVKPDCLDAVADDESVQSEIKHKEVAKKPKKSEKSEKSDKKK